MYTAVDLFAGAGGLSTGLTAAGFHVKVAVEIDSTSAATFRKNHPDTALLLSDIRKVTGPTILRQANLKKGDLTLLTGCPPCQGFSTLRTRRRVQSAPDPRNDLIFELLRIVRSIQPRAVLIENVPGLSQDGRFTRFLEGLKRANYQFDFEILDAQNFGVPQRRKRLVLLAVRDGSIPSQWSRSCGSKRTVRDAIAHLPHAGTSGDALHDVPERRHEAVMNRIRATPPDGGSQRDLEPRLRCKCHVNSDGYSDVYGRMAWDAVAPTITSGCHNPSKGRFLHPELHRAVTLREAALLQTFPPDYEFDLSRGKEDAARQIGNAFPPALIQPIARRLIEEGVT